MNWLGNNPYYNPEKCNLRILEVHERPGACYDFDMVVLWEDLATGKQYWARDSGCSCPSPFEDYHSLSEMNDLTFTKDEYKKVVSDISVSRDW